MTENRLTQYWAEQQNPAAAQEQNARRQAPLLTLQLQLLSGPDLYRAAQQRAVFDYQLNRLFNPDYYQNDAGD